MKIISPKTHSIIDYAVVAFLWLSPILFGFSGTIALVTYALGLVHLILTIITRFPGGLLHLLPLKGHGVIELIVSIVLIVMPFVFPDFFQGDSQIFYVSFGAAIFLVWLFTEYSSEESK